MSTTRREFLKTSAAVLGIPLVTSVSRAAPTKTSPPETAVKALYDSLTEKQKASVCFAWDHVDPKRGVLRTRVQNNWQITPHTVNSDFYTVKQRGIIRDIVQGITHPDWHAKFDQQTKDDSGGKPWGTTQSIAIFGQPGRDQFEFVITGRHQTLRADGNTTDGVAFGGPIFYGHAPHDNEEPTHPGNVFWSQAVAANKVYAMLEKKQRKQALQETSPREAAVEFRKTSPGLLVKEMSRDQQAEMHTVLAALIEPFRVEDRDEVLASLKAQGGLEACRLSYFKDGDIGDDKVWDNWRLEGPAFVWHYRGDPHVHVWVNIASNPSVKTNAG
jgi:hypothetical protein